MKGVDILPIRIDNELPAKQSLEIENIFVMSKMRGDTQDIRPLKIVILNLMPTKLETETQLLRLLSMNNFDMEENSRGELLTSFKRAYGRSIRNFRMILDKHCSGLSRPEADQILYVFFPFMFGIYPYAEVTAKQKEAMKEAEVDYKYQTIYEITYNCLIQLLKNQEELRK